MPEVTHAPAPNPPRSAKADRRDVRPRWLERSPFARTALALCGGATASLACFALLAPLLELESVQEVQCGCAPATESVFPLELLVAAGFVLAGVPIFVLAAATDVRRSVPFLWCATVGGTGLAVVLDRATGAEPSLLAPLACGVPALLFAAVSCPLRRPCA